MKCLGIYIRFFSFFFLYLLLFFLYTIQALKPNPLHPCHRTGYLPPHLAIKFALDVFWPTSLAKELQPRLHLFYVKSADQGNLSQVVCVCNCLALAWSKHLQPNHSRGHPLVSNCLCWDLLAETFLAELSPCHSRTTVHPAGSRLLTGHHSVLFLWAVFG